MPSKTKIGRDTENFVGKVLVNSNWWQEYYRPPNVRYNHKDIFSMFDLISLETSGRIVLTQVKTNISHYYSFKKPLIDWTNKKIHTEDYAPRLNLIWTDKRLMRVFCPYTQHEQSYFINNQKLTKRVDSV